MFVHPRAVGKKRDKRVIQDKSEPRNFKQKEHIFVTRSSTSVSEGSRLAPRFDAGYCRETTNNCRADIVAKPEVESRKSRVGAGDREMSGGAPDQCEGDA